MWFLNIPLLLQLKYPGNVSFRDSSNRKTNKNTVCFFCEMALLVFKWPDIALKPHSCWLLQNLFHTAMAFTELAIHVVSQKCAYSAHLVLLERLCNKVVICTKFVFFCVCGVCAHARYCLSRLHGYLEAKGQHWILTHSSGASLSIFCNQVSYWDFRLSLGWLANELQGSALTYFSALGLWVHATMFNTYLFNF